MILHVLYFTLAVYVTQSQRVPAVKINTKRKGSDVLNRYPLIDGHNDLPMNILCKLNNKINHFDFETDLTTDPIFGHHRCTTCQTDLLRLKKGRVGGQFWAAFVECDGKDHYVTRTLEQIDVIKRLVKNHCDVLKFTTTANGIIEAFNEEKIASLIGVEGGHAIENRLSILRIYYELGVRYMTLTHNCNLQWADANVVDRKGYQPIRNLTGFGKKVIREMNRLGMMVDLSHTSRNVMLQALDVSLAPVIFSHSSSKAIHNHERNVDDDVLIKLKCNGGVIMVNFYPDFLTRKTATIENVAAHINHIVDRIGIDHVGIGADYDGVDRTPEGLEDVSKYPHLFDFLEDEDFERWTPRNLEKLAGRNLMRVFKAVEKVRDRMKNVLPAEDLIYDFH